MEKTCTGCVVSAGTHKPAEALHQQIDEPQTQQPKAQAAPDERGAFEAWLGIKPCGAAHDFGWAAWQARAALSAPQPPEAAPVRKPLKDDEIEAATGAKQGTPLFLAAKGFTIAIERAHGIKD